ncbi:hypothetical protein PAEPH01_0595 [Pancytospora epiphaga]|nr:hypothetical protein PAEPH01_0595 [Pancytospora epiphaga]
MDRYGALERIGEGTFGKVYKSIDKQTGNPIAIKIVPLDPESGFPFTVIRETRVLKKLKHPNVLGMIDIYISGGNVAIVLEYMPYDVGGLLAKKYRFSNEQIRSFAYQMVSAVSHIHTLGFIHRDLKPGNLLVDAAGRLKIADFGLTRRSTRCMTNRICTLWYRAPELLLGDTLYSNKVDAWSIGCIILELKTGRPFFRGEDEISHTREVLSKLGPPKQKYPWNTLFDVERYTKNCPWTRTIAALFSSILEEDLLELVGEFLRLDKNSRISVTNALEMRVVKRGKNLYVPLDLNILSNNAI